MKKYAIITVVFILSLFIAVSSASAARMSAKEVLNALESVSILPSGYRALDQSKAVTRAEFSYMAARLLNMNTDNISETVFEDVPSDDKYAGSIALLKQIGLVGGVSETEFAPDNPATLDMCCKILVGVIGYGDYAAREGGWPMGYRKIAMDFDLLDGVKSSDNYINRESAAIMVYNALVAGIDTDLAVENPGNILITDKKANTNLLSSKFGIRAYKGYVEEVGTNGKFEFVVSGNAFPWDSNTAGERINVFADDTLNIYEYDLASVIGWIDGNDKLIFLKLDDNASIKYGYVDSVNGNTNSGSYYAANNVKEITLLDDSKKYKTTSSVRLKYNGEYTLRPHRLVGNFVKLVINDDKVVSIESWDLNRGGIISGIDESSITYRWGNQASVKLSDIDDVKVKRIYLNDEVADLSDIKNETTFSYYKDEDIFVFVGSEIILSDIVEAYTDDEIQIGSSSYLKSEEIYMSEDGKVYKSGNIADFVGMSVQAYVGPDKTIWYIKTIADTTGRRKFYGVVDGVDIDRLGNTAKIQLFTIEDEIKKEIFEIDLKRANRLSVPIEELVANSENTEGKGIYEFKVSAKGKISSIERLTYYSGYGAETKYTPGTTTIIDATVPGLSIPTDSGSNKYIFFPGSKMIAITTLDGEFFVGNITWEDLRGRKADGATFSFYGTEYDALPTLITVAGNLEKLGAKQTKAGLVVDKKVAVNDVGEFVVLEVITASGATESYMVSPEKWSDNNPKYAFITYSDNLLFNTDEINIESNIIDLTGSPNDWAVATGENEGLHKGFVKMITKDMILLDDGNRYFVYLHEPTRLFLSHNADNTGEVFKSIEYSDIKEGDQIFYYLKSNMTFSVVIKVN